MDVTRTRRPGWARQGVTPGGELFGRSAGGKAHSEKPSPAEFMVAGLGVAFHPDRCFVPC